MTQKQFDTASPGAQLEALCAKAQSEVVLVAPFVKLSALERVLVCIADGITVRCVTRWRPDEIISGVSDLEVWPLLKERPNTSLWLRPDLHAKFYRADDQCLVGSANVTGAALGWSRQPNLELLISASASDPQLGAFEAELFLGSVQVEDSLFEQLKQAVELLAEHRAQMPTPETDVLQNLIVEEDEVLPPSRPDTWLPTLRHPEKLYVAYSNQLERLSAAAKMTALSDLRALAVPPDLPKPAFEAYVGALLLQKPIVRRVDNFVVTPQRFGAVRDLLASLPCASKHDFDASRAWQALMRWLRHFLPDRYVLVVPHHSEVFCRVG